ncbi:hypothetical protein [Macrococcoides caseolyticum]|uniref:hypothetical protein n=1 Tax=Macrococcoides caseolyticum TaxID=69966 RepID=UPI000C34CF6D|nr:hypothetical protein [Macrococcus caseolyticus]PKE20727.1 hypothetical protein CW688_10980 [Macrococcus caseolyticus]PKE71374.1 hypothetical protein CW665_10805 [Macrococcus caseolyticus]PKF05327.1 hypothetical protein CW698_10545 [Macrococcus caseolyticus]
MTEYDIINDYLNVLDSVVDVEAKQETNEQIIDRLSKENARYKSENKQLQADKDGLKQQLHELATQYEKAKNRIQSNVEEYSKIQENKKYSVNERKALLKNIKEGTPYDELFEQAINCIYLMINDKGFLNQARKNMENREGE